MELIRGLYNIRESHRGAVVTIGSFDGLHRGHRMLIETARAEAARRSCPAMMVSFEPLPREFLQAGDPPARLTNFRERWRVLQGSGLDALLLLHFDERLRNLGGPEFLRWLTGPLAVAGVVVGHDFRFGRAGEASAEYLARAGRESGFSVEVIDPVLEGGERVSSSAVRAALAARQLERAERLLERRYSLRGRVVRGDQLGRTLGFPTANIRLHRRRSPLAGIYAAHVHGIGSAPRGAVVSLGTRPTVGGREPLLEAHVFDWSGDLYGRELEVEFLAYLREEQRFDNLEAMQAQMRNDAERARGCLAGMKT